MKQLIIGLTGGFGTGKTTVAGFLKRLGAKVIDADEIAHKLLESDKVVYKKITGVFGRGVLKKDKTIDRHRLAALAFNDSGLLSRLNEIIHPRVVKLMERGIKLSSKKIIILDVPLLFEAGLESLTDKIIVVKAGRAEQLKRLLNKTSFAKPDILKRIHAQMPLSEKLRRADFVIDNNGTLKQTEGQARRLYNKLKHVR